MHLRVYLQGAGPEEAAEAGELAGHGEHIEMEAQPQC